MNHIKLEDRKAIDDLWGKDILEGNHFLEGRKIMEAVKNGEEDRYKRCLVY